MIVREKEYTKYTNFSVFIGSSKLEVKILIKLLMFQIG